MSGAVAASWAAVVAVVVVTVGVGAYGQRRSRTTSDFLVASRTVGPVWNASAVGGEYLSAASFLGIAGLVLVHGPDLLWYPVGYTAGFLVLLVLVAAPLRRSGAYTLPDFAEARLGSSRVRAVCVVLVVAIGWLYLLPQLQGAGLTLRTVTGAPPAAGAVAVAAVVTVNVLAGGMRAITFVQAVQYWLKLTALLVPVCVLLLAWRADGAPSPVAEVPPVLPVPATLMLDEDAVVDLPAPVVVRATGEVDGRAVDGPLALGPGPHAVAAGTALVLPEGSPVPAWGDDGPPGPWEEPLSGAGSRSHPLYATYSLVLATFLGTMGLPHVLVRFYTNPDGRSARRTGLAVLALLGAFYLLPPVVALLGRVYAPDLALSGDADAVALLLPSRVLPGWPGTLLGAVVAAGAFAAFLSTSSGLVVSIAGTFARDVLRGGVRDFRVGAVLAGVVPLAASLAVPRLPASVVVGLAFAVAASSFCPLLVLGIWWRGLSAAGAAAGLVVGGGLAVAAVAATLAGLPADGWAAAVLARPAAVTVPLAFAVMVVVSRLTPGSVPADARRTLLRLHVPEDVARRLRRPL